MNFKNKLLIVFSFLIIVLLNETILPKNEILPKLTILFESLKSLLVEYNFLYHFSITVVSIYLLLLIVTSLTTFIFAYFIPYANRKRIKFNDANILFSFLILLILISASDFHNSKIGLILTLILFFITNSIKISNDLSSQVFKNSLLSINLKLSKSDFRKKILFKFLFKSKLEFLVKYHSFVWLLIILNEYLFDEQGLGYLFHKMVEYRDYAGVICLSIITLFISSSGYALFRKIKRKLNNE